MSSIKYHIKNVNLPNRKTNWHIVVKVTRKWREIDTQNGNVLGVNMIFIDQSHDRIRAWMDSTVMNNLENKFVEGQTLKVQNFKVQEYTNLEDEKCFEDDRFIRLTHYTRVREHMGLGCLIPENIFVFKNLSDVPNHQHRISSCIDVVGIVHSVDPLKLSSKTNRRYTDLVITDTRYYVKIRLWDELGAMFNKAMNNLTEYPAVSVFASLKIEFSEKYDITYLTNNVASRFYLNCNVEREETLRKRFNDLHGC
ncbi:hypothetical protein POM88_029506 [Heracleum sosnowskyi]|uniref:Replication protein A 70 kDa DNA-binding subunit B/D first OB fold domain-containing protein n=1 Tax=Heracleum sosnowskyi TaxID=360622 RepID=A0AAD8HUW4_9APIA|nr:hypothetical protein POM88_029506 [Heracleum sosnowskyi]